ncbi:MAG: hypothetical protein IPP22_13085 [Nitrosomonas sp.]|nr:hypothetical protein [Nitrosomonas sp.]
MEYQKTHSCGVAEAFKKGGVLKNECASQSISIISLLKGGSTIRNLDEKFVSNLVTYIGSMSVLIATNLGRFSFGPQLSFSYEQGSAIGTNHEDSLCA